MFDTIALFLGYTFIAVVVGVIVFCACFIGYDVIKTSPKVFDLIKWKIQIGKKVDPSFRAGPVFLIRAYFRGLNSLCFDADVSFHHVYGKWDGYKNWTVYEKSTFDSI